MMMGNDIKMNFVSFSAQNRNIRRKSFSLMRIVSSVFVASALAFDGSGDETCSRSAVFEEFLDRSGTNLFKEIFGNEKDSFSRRPGKVTDGLLRREAQFTQAGFQRDVLMDS